MPKRVFIIHGWGGYPEEAWIPWLRQELTDRGFTVAVPSMPDTNNPKKEAWIGHLSELVGQCDEETYFVGHSLGCQTILRYFQLLPSGTQAGGAVFVAGFEVLTAKDKEEEAQRVLGPWTREPIDWDRIKEHCEKFVAIFSDNDEWVAIENVKIFEEKIGARTMVLHDKEHFSESSGITELPEALEAVLAMTQ